MNIYKIYILILTLFITFLIGLYIYYTIQESKVFLTECQKKGYDGIKYTSRYTNNLECSNFTQAEKDSKEIKENLK